MKPFIKNTLKQFHQHRKKDDDIFIFGLGRSGTTLLAEILNTDRKSKLCSEPFALHSENKKILLKYFEADFLADRYLDLLPNDFYKVISYLHDLSKGKTWNSFYWSDFPGNDHRFSTNRTIFKIHKLTYLFIEIMAEIPAKGVYLIRHPLSHSISRMRNQWDTYASLFLNSKKIRQLLDSKAVEKANQIIQEGSQLEKFVLSWALENYIVLYKAKNNQLPDNILLISFEELITYPEKSLRKISSHCNLTYNNSMMKKVSKPSHGIVHSTSETRNQILEGKHKKLANKWKQEISLKDEAKAFRILEIMGIDYYNTEHAFPSN
ncbi:MAG: sulfotransferase [Bacteroidales bacterium]|nr:sulfotransferase [Bacteroidales bacterium]